MERAEHWLSEKIGMKRKRLALSLGEAFNTERNLPVLFKLYSETNTSPWHISVLLFLNMLSESTHTRTHICICVIMPTRLKE